MISNCLGSFPVVDVGDSVFPLLCLISISLGVSSQTGWWMELRHLNDLDFVKRQMQVLRSPYRAKFEHRQFLGVTESLPLVMVKPSLSTRLPWVSVATYSKGFSMIKGLMRKMHSHVFHNSILIVVAVEGIGSPLLLQLWFHQADNFSLVRPKAPNNNFLL